MVSEFLGCPASEGVSPWRRVPGAGPGASVGDGGMVSADVVLGSPRARCQPGPFLAQTFRACGPSRAKLDPRQLALKKGKEKQS